MTAIPEGAFTSLRIDNLMDSPHPQSIRLNGFSAFYLTNKPSQITFQGELPQVYSLRPGIFAIVRPNNSYNQIPIPNESDIMTLIPRRDISKIQQPSQISSRRFVLIMYNPFKDELNRQKTSRLYQRTPLIRIRPGVVLAPQIRSTRFRPYQKVLLRPGEYVQKLIELGTYVWYASRLELHHTTSEVLIKQLLFTTIDNRVQRIITACRQLYTELRNSSKNTKPINDFTQRFTRIRHRVKYLRWQALFFKKEFNIDFQSKSARAYAATSHVYQQLKIM
jgi:hypothetical protein